LQIYLFGSKFIRDTMYQLLSESAEFCRRYDINIWLLFVGHGILLFCIVFVVCESSCAIRNLWRRYDKTPLLQRIEFLFGVKMSSWMSGRFSEFTLWMQRRSHARYWRQKL